MTPRLVRCLIAVGLSLASASARAAAGPEAGACAAEVRKSDELRGSLNACEERARASEKREKSQADHAAQLGHQLQQSQAATAAAHSSRDALCASVGELGRWVVDGAAAPGGLGGCLAPETQSRIATQLGSWSRVEAELHGLLLYEAGARDELPAAGPPSLPVDRTMAQLLAGGDGRAPLLYRRVLLAAFRRVAPRAWARLQASGRPGIDAWLASPAPLDAKLVDEVRRSAAGAEGAGQGPTLAAGLSLVQTYLELARCPLSPWTPECRRASQLQSLLETTGPLVLQRREQAIWATDCRTLVPARVLDWLQDLPPSQRGSDAWGVVADAAFTKLYTCFLEDRAAGSSFPAWSSRVLPGLGQLTGQALTRVDLVRRRFVEGGEEDLCGRALRALQTLPAPKSCSLPDPAEEALTRWLGREPHRTAEARATVRACGELLAAEWQGRAASVPSAFQRPPGGSELVRVGSPAPALATTKLRSLCADRRGGAGFAEEARPVVRVATLFGEAPEAGPWHFDGHGQPIEQQRFARASRPSAWARRLFSASGACEAVALDAGRCDRCSGAEASAFFDCTLAARLERRWSRWQRALWVGLAIALAGAAGVTWVVRWVAAWRRFGAWSARVRRHFASVDLPVRRSGAARLRPSQLQFVEIELPRTQVWERWGRRAVVCRSEGGARLLERDVNGAAQRARAVEAEVALLAHDPGASPDLPAVRALLEWAGRGSRKAVQVLPVSAERLQWLRGSDDLLDLVEQTSLRGNPFEVRGRITSASQFFDRERIVSGLLASVQAGSWSFVAGLRRFGKSSLALEVARRLPGPSAYVDLAGFYHEIAFAEDPARSADTILRYLSHRLRESFLARYGEGAQVPAPLPAGPLDSGLVAVWLREFAAAAARGEGQRATSVLLIFDELEQALAVPAERLPRALEVLSVLVGRLRSASADPGSSAARIGVVLCGTMHPLLWAPMPALAGQSLLGSLETVFLPGLPDDAAQAMMRGLGARQGIRFTDEALQLVVREAQGIALLVRRIGSSVLELYDPERARQGGLGALEIGIEGATAAVAREEEEGSPLRVWVESEIADAQTPTGKLLRALAREGRMEAGELRRQAAALVEREFQASGIDRLLTGEERRRRLLEAAAVTVRLLGETGLLEPEGNLTNPDAYVFREGIVRRILASARSGSFALG